MRTEGAVYSGPVGLLTIDGRLRIGTADEVEAGDCFLVAPGAVSRLSAGEPLPAVLMFGIIPAEKELWAEGGAQSENDQGSPPRSLSCAGQGDSVGV